MLGLHTAVKQWAAGMDPAARRFLFCVLPPKMVVDTSVLEAVNPHDRRGGVRRGSEQHSPMESLVWMSGAHPGCKACPSRRRCAGLCIGTVSAMVHWIDWSIVLGLVAVMSVLLRDMGWT